MEPSVLRLFRFRPAGPGFDAKLRDILIPDLIRLPGIRGVFAGRVGPDEVGDRLVASLWTTEPGMTRALGADFDSALFHPELLPDTTDRRLDARRIAFSAPPDSTEDIGIIRVVDGTTQAGQLDAYVADVRAGTTSDRSAGVGPRALYLAVTEPDHFLTLSLWDTWSHVEAATGSDVNRVDRTRHEDRLVAWTVEHYEVVPGIAVVLMDEAEGLPA